MNNINFKHIAELLIDNKTKDLNALKSMYIYRCIHDKNFLKNLIDMLMTLEEVKEISNDIKKEYKKVRIELSDNIYDYWDKHQLI